MSPTSYATGRDFLPSLEGLRAVAAFGVMGTHLAFLNGIPQHTTIGAILARADFFVAVFFALSAFLLWRRHRTGVNVRRYATTRAARIVPAYLVTVAVVAVMVPATYGTPWWVWAATATFTQVYFPHALAPSLTHLWSMAVEVAFYVVLPWLPRRWPLLLALGASSLGWAWVPFVADFHDGGINGQIYPPAFLPWFAVGLLAAEWEARGFPTWARRAARWRPVWWAVAVVVMWVAAQPWFGPAGLVHPTAGEFARRILAGTLFAALVLLPYAIAPDRSLLARPTPRWLGRISYCVFLVHLPVMETSMALMGITPFHGSVGRTCLVAAVSVPATCLVAWLLYSRVEHTAATMLQPAKATSSPSPA